MARKWLPKVEYCSQLTLPVVNGLRVVLGLSDAVEACAGPSPINPILIKATCRDRVIDALWAVWSDDFVVQFI
jgi:hypothetical protein